MAYNLIVTYQLGKSSIHYQDVETAIKSLGDWAHLQRTTWYVKSNLPVSQARERIWQYMQLGDSLFVADMGSASWQGLTKECSDFIKLHWNK
jgi:hypothetical protein